MSIEGVSEGFLLLEQFDIAESSLCPSYLLWFNTRKHLEEDLLIVSGVREFFNKKCHICCDINDRTT